MSTESNLRFKKIVSLCQCSNGSHATVVDVKADAELLARLMGMGLFTGTRFQLLRCGSGTFSIPFLLAIGETRIAIDHTIADMIIVERT
jgi:Fe2+ transport system protein FeoA